MAPTFKVLDEEPTPALHESEIRVPTAGTWLALGAGVLVVVAGFIWTIL
ncbi:hypothetical protein [uncultured Reyranella sp.]|nr:hypothetical protein [uncultured Reyranella sp.]